MARRSSTATASRRTRHDEDEEVEETPRSRRSNRDEEEDEAPRSRTRGRIRHEDDEEDDAPRSRRGGRSRHDEEEEDDEPRSRRGGRSRDREDSGSRRERDRGKSTTIGKGWAGAEKNKDIGGGDFANPWKLPNKRTLVKILDEEPFINYAEHWLQKSGKKSYVCLGEDCPLCDAGERPSAYSLFNILDLSDPDNPKNEYWRVSRKVLAVLKEYAEDRRTSPLNRDDLYFVIWKTEGKGGAQQTNVNSIKARDVLDDYECEPLTEEELEEYAAQGFDESVVYVNTRRDLLEVVEELED